MFGKKNRILGLDIGSSEVKGIELSETGGNFFIAGFSSAKVHSPDETRFAIREVLRKGRFKTKRAVTSVSGRSVIVRYVTMPKMNTEELQSAIRFEADKYIPFEVEEVVLDCQILEEAVGTGESGQPEMKVLLVAVKKSLIEEHVDLLKGVDLQPTIIDVDAFALGNAFELRNLNTGRTDLANKVVSLIDIGANKTNINILKGMISYFTREVYLAGNDFTEAISRRLQIEASEAEELKIDPRDRVGEVEECVLPALDDLSNEIQLSFDYFENQFDREVEEVYISGGSSKLPGLLKAFESSFDKPIVFWDPLENMEIKSDKIDVRQVKKISSQLAVTVGLASRLRRG